jgi:hypothetical protein
MSSLTLSPFASCLARTQPTCVPALLVSFGYFSRHSMAFFALFTTPIGGLKTGTIYAIKFLLF